MKKLTPRQQFILNSLLNEGSLEIKNLQNEFSIGDKTIYREVTAINNYLKKYKLNVYNFDNSRLVISGKKDDINKLKKSIEKVPIQWVLNKHQRQLMILIELLLSKEPIKAAYFKTKYNVAMASISFDIDAIEEWLINKNLYLVKKKSYGIEIEGPQWNKRNTLSELFFSIKPLENLLNYFYDEKPEPVIDYMFKAAFGQNVTEILKEIFKTTEIAGLNNNDIKYFEFFIQVLISIKNTENERTMSLPDNIVEEIINSSKFSKLDELCEKLRENDIILPREEIAYLNLYISNYQDNKDKKIDISGMNISSVVTEFIEEISKKINIDLTSDIQLRNNLYQHFNESVNVLNIGLKIINPLLEEIKEHNEHLFEAVSNVCKLIFSRYNINIPPDEIGYITLHIDVAIKRYKLESEKIRVFVICPTGMSTAKILSSRISSTFSDLNIVKFGSVYDWRQIEEDNGYDLIISTFNIGNNTRDNIIIVSPFLNIDDIGRINEFIYKYKKKSISMSKAKEEEKLEIDVIEKNEVAEMLINNFRLKNLEVDSYEELILSITEDIESIGITENKEEIAKLIIEREHKGNVVIPGSKVALFHTRSDEIKHAFIGAYRINKPIKMSSIGFSYENVDTFFVMLARISDENEALKLLGKISVALIENKDFTKKLEASDIEANREIIRRIIYTRED